MVERKGFTLIALTAYWSRGRAKLKLGIARGKKAHDKRASIKDRDWKRDKARILKPS
jgi:SsrA-binding protein